MGIGSWYGMVFGLSLPAIILMYLLKRKFINTLVPSHLLWQRVLRNVEANRPWQKLQNRLLLWLQLIVAALLVFSLMQPYWWVSDQAKDHMVMVADTSGSMSAKIAEPNREGESINQQGIRLDLLKSQMKDYLKEHAKSSEITLLSLDLEPQIVVSREKSHARVEEAIDSLQPYYGKASYKETLSLATALTRDGQDAEVVVFTDGQWKGNAEGISFQVPSKVMMIDTQTLRNIAIKQFGIQQQSTGNTAVVVLQSSVGETRPTDYSLYGDDELLLTQTAEWSGTKTMTFRLENVQDAQVYRLELQDADAYEADNVSYAFNHKSSTPRILLLSSGNLFLEKAIQLTGAEMTKMIISTTGTDANEQEDGGIGMSSPPIPKEVPDLIVVDGEMPEFLHNDEWAQMLKKTALWTIGGTGKAVKAGGERVKLKNHALTEYLTLSGIYFGTVLDRNDLDWGEAIVEIGNKPAIYAGEKDGHPRLSYLFRLEDSDLPLSAEFPIMVNHAVSWLTSESGYGLGRVIAGNSIDVPLMSDVTKAQWVAQGGLALSNKVDAIDADQGSSGYTTAQKTPSVPGLYAFEQQDTKGDTSRYWVDVTADPFEGALGEKVALSLAKEIAAPNVEVGDTEQNNSASVKTDEGLIPMSLIWLIAGLALVLILLEWGVYQRGHSI
ncbi:vWA domain-containing protein [Paenibacillus sp. CMAA1364]